MDGEGHLSLGRIPRGGRSVEYPVRVVVYNSNYSLLEEIRQTWEGVLTDSGQRSPRWKTGYALIWTNALAAKLLRAVEPFLRVKSRQAAMLLRFVEHMKRTPRIRDSRGRLLPLPERELRVREIFHLRFKSLNARGSRPRSSGVEQGPPVRRIPIARLHPSPAYLAGFIEAEGCLMIAKTTDRTYHRTRYVARICVSNTKKSVIEELQRAYGGILADKPPQRAGWKRGYLLIWTVGMIERVLDAAGPYLISKRGQAMVMTEFIRHVKGTPRALRHKGSADLPGEVLAVRAGLYRRMRELNAKGPYAQPLTAVQTENTETNSKTPRA